MSIAVRFINRADQTDTGVVFALSEVPDVNDIISLEDPPFEGYVENRKWKINDRGLVEVQILYTSPLHKP